MSTPSNDFFGGKRPGANLFGESLVCLDALTGKRKWHFQIVHHGLWDYDLASPPTLGTITVGGKRIDAVVQLTKEGFAFVFDRVSGKPVWPIEERTVPASDVPGEHSYPTQPFPSKPPALSPQGVTLEDAFDLTPELKAEAQAEMKKLRLGPLFTPPSYQGTLMLPGMIGGANWGGGAFDPETGMLYVKTSNVSHIARVKQPDKSSKNPARFGGGCGLERRSDRHQRHLPSGHPAHQAALRASDRGRSEPWVDRLEGAVRRLAGAPQEPCARRGEAA